MNPDVCGPDLPTPHVASGRRHRKHPGVHAVGHARLTRHGAWMAAVLACGEGALLSHRDAAALWGLRPSDRSRIDVTTPGARSRAPRGIQLHRTSTLLPQERAEHEGIPVTSVARTLVDLAAVLRPQALDRAVHEAEVLRLLDVAAVAAAMGHGGRRGVAALRRILAVPDAGVPRREFERRFHLLCRRAGLPMPRCNTHVHAGGRLLEVDALWPGHGVAVELDGRAVHLTAGGVRGRPRPRRRAPAPRHRGRAGHVAAADRRARRRGRGPPRAA